MDSGKAMIILSTVDKWFWACKWPSPTSPPLPADIAWIASHEGSNVRFFFSVRLFEKKSPHRSSSKQKLLLISKQVEIALYRTAKSLDEYLDKRTLNQRIRQIAIDTIRDSTIQIIANNNNIDCNCSVRRGHDNSSNTPASACWIFVVKAMVNENVSHSYFIVDAYVFIRLSSCISFVQK